MKLCKRCGVEQPLENFGPSKRAGDGHYPWCRPCAADYRKAGRAEDPEKAREYGREQYRRNLERARALGAAGQKRRREADPEAHNTKRRVAYEKNPEPVREAARRYRENNPEAVLASRRAGAEKAKLRQRIRLLASRGLTLESYDAMAAAQNGVCVICGKSPTGRRPFLFIDHDHKTGKVRGLLCGLCNAAIGQLGDRIEDLHAAVKYLDGA